MHKNYSTTNIKRDIKYNYNVRNKIVQMLRDVFEEDMDIYSSGWTLKFTVAVYIASQYAECQKGTILNYAENLRKNILDNEDGIVKANYVTKKRINKWVEIMKKEGYNND